ncbi:MAG: cytochrome-c oxidase, cbb3-type subunit III [Robiginitomaculum sp.]|nr:MAG: cytochrome-c oxidase, cbb3-type subunit III [Robiginitomaculum sp.]
MSDRPEVDDHSGTETTGHEWDGIKELNTPLPRWWLTIWFGCIAIALVYMVLMPSWPLPWANTYVKGLRHYSERANFEKDMVKLAASRGPAEQQLANTPIDQVENNPEMLNFALAAGKSAFGDNCATCHGSSGVGNFGYPALVDDVWLWGGTLDDIQYTITNGIRSTGDDTRLSQMPAFGRDELLSKDEIKDLVEYVTQLSGGDADAEAVARATPLFADNCAMCHGDNGTGMRELGAPNLTDADWIYAGDRAAITETITNSRNGVMPTWEGRLEPWKIDALAIYVHALGGGE